MSNNNEATYPFIENPFDQRMAISGILLRLYYAKEQENIEQLQNCSCAAGQYPTIGRLRNLSFLFGHIASSCWSMNACQSHYFVRDWVNCVCNVCILSLCVDTMQKIQFSKCSLSATYSILHINLYYVCKNVNTASYSPIIQLLIKKPRNYNILNLRQQN